MIVKNKSEKEVFKKILENSFKEFNSDSVQEMFCKFCEFLIPVTPSVGSRHPIRQFTSYVQGDCNFFFVALMYTYIHLI